MGAVFKARQISLDRTVALKVLPPAIAKDKNFIERFQREARASAILNHPNIVQGIDVGHDQDLWYFAMEFVDGPTLNEVLKKELKLPQDRVLKIGRDMALALVCAEKKNIVHRDIKPDNILITSRGETKLADLGLAKKTSADEDDASLTQSGKAIGTPHYMPPEQIRGELDKLDIRSDIYSLGATLFHLLTGQTPFMGKTGAEIMAKHLTEKPPFAHRVSKGVSEPLSRLVARMMEKEKENRVQSAEELVGAFEALMDGGDAGHTTGPQMPVRASRRTTGPRAPVRGVGTTGPRKPVRGATTGPRFPVKGRAEGESRAPAKKSPVAGIVAGAMAVVAVLILLVLGMGGDEGTTAEKKNSRRRDDPDQARQKQAKDRTHEDKEESKNVVAASPVADNKREKWDQQARSAFSELSRFKDTRSDDTSGRIKQIEAFLAKYGKSSSAHEARTLLTQLKLAESKSLKNEKPEETVEKIDPPADVTDKAKVSEEAFQKLSAFEGVKEDDWEGRIESVEGFLKESHDKEVLEKARKVLAKLKADRDLASKSQDAALAAGAQEAYSKFTETYLSLLRAGEHDQAASRLRKAERNAALAGLKDQLNIAKKVPEWLANLETAASKGAEQLKEVESFELKPARGSPLKVGKKADFQVSEVKEGTIYVGRKGVSMPIKISRLDTATRDQLAALVEASDGASKLSRAFGMLLALGSSGHAPQVKEVKTMLSQAGKAGASAKDVAWVSDLLERASKGAVEVMAKNAWTSLQQDLKAKNWEDLANGLSAFSKQHGQTKFAASKQKEITELGAKVRHALQKEKAGPLNVGLVWHMTFETMKGNRIVDESGNHHDGTVQDGGRCVVGGRSGKCLYLAGKAQVHIDHSERFEWGGADFSLAAWINTRRNDGSIISKAPAKGKWERQGRALFIRGGRLHFDSGWVGTAASRTRISDGEWHHIAMTYRFKDKQVTLYINGKSEASKTLGKTEPDPKNFMVRLGYTAPNFGGQLDGRLDDVRGYARLLSDQEVAQLAHEIDAMGKAQVPSGPVGGRVDAAFIKKVSTLDPERQFQAVVKKLKELNPEFDERRARKRVFKGKEITEVWLRMSGVSDISPLRAIPTLQRLYLGDAKGSAFTDLKQISGLSLRYLDLQRNPVSDLSPLAGMPLEGLQLGGTRVTDLAPLKEMPLRDLMLWSTPVTDLSPLKGLALKRVDLRKSKVTDLSPLKGSSLSSLTIESTGITSLDALKEMPHLQSLRMGYTSIADLSALKECKKLKSLFVPGSKVTDLGPLKGLPLQTFEMFNTSIADISALKGMPLNYLQANDSKLSDLSPLKGMKDLRRLSLRNTKVKDISPLKGLGLRDLDITNTPVQDMEPLKGMKIQSLQLTYKPGYKEMIKALPEIKRLNGRRLDDFWKRLAEEQKKKRK